MNNVDQEYFRLLQTIIQNGREKKNRTGTNTIGVFGEMAKFDVKLNAFPILTTKRVWFKGIVHELLWFIKGDTNIKYLVDNDVGIWNEWAYKKYIDTSISEIPEGHLESLFVPSGFSLSDVSHLTMEMFIDRIKEDPEFAKKWGELGEGTYGSMWRNFPGPVEKGHMGWEDKQITVDQLQKVIDKLKTNPDDRRMIVSAWHPYWVDHCALPPCHCLFHFNTEELTWQERWTYAINIGKHCGVTWENEQNLIEHLDIMNIPKRRLNLLLYIRSNDMFLGAPFNISSYSLMICMVAHCVGMEPGTLTYTIGDAHIYNNHIEQVKLQLTRNPMKLPKLWINPNIKDLFALTYDDIKLIDYISHPSIKGEVAV